VLTLRHPIFDNPITNPCFSTLLKRSQYYKSAPTMPSQRSLPRRGGPPSGRPQQARGRGRGGRNGRGGHAPNQAQRQQTKFKGNCTELQGQIFDCSDYRQADTFVNTLKRISEYVGAKYKHGGDIRSSIIHETKATLPVPIPPTVADSTALTPQEEVAKMIFKGELEAYTKHKAALDDNIQKAYSLVIGQCTDLLQSKLKQQAQWSAISEEQDAIALIGLIKTITFRFEDQKFLPLALYLSKGQFIQPSATQYDQS
jgi:hypothetical protein